jgi:geranylgeranyl diphosphate synthase type II
MERINGMNQYQEKYLQYKQEIDRRLTRCIKKNKPVSLYEPMKYILSGGGKRIRPLLVLLGCEAVGGAYRDALPAAVAIEVLHNFTLVHDDIMDNAKTRRGRATVHTKWDTNVAILTGDELVAIAYRELLKTISPVIAEVASVFTEGVVEVCEGQSYDKEFEMRPKVTLDEYFLMIGKKTGKLVSVALEMGALIGGATASEVHHLSEYGRYVGRAFQIQDDLLDVIADEKEFGKTIGGDIVEGKKTYLLLQAYERAKGKDKRLLVTIIRKGGAPKHMVDTVRSIYHRTNVIESAKAIIRKNIEQARRQLRVFPKTEAKTMLEWFAEMLLQRNF